MRSLDPESDVEGSGLPPLPPLPPTPKARLERLRSIAIVAAAAAIGQCIVHGLAAYVGTDTAPTVWILIHYASYANVAISIIGLVLFQLTDPGWVQRSTETCTPLPPHVASRLQAGMPLDSLSNHLAEDGSGSFCMRCCVWRAPSSHHCSICNRCCRNFDHHCAVLGRCVSEWPPSASRAAAAASDAPDAPGGNRLLFLVNVGNLVASCGVAALAATLMTLTLLLISPAFGFFFMLLIAWPTTAIAIAYVRNEGIWDELVGMFTRGPRRRRAAARKAM